MLRAGTVEPSTVEYSNLGLVHTMALITISITDAHLGDLGSRRPRTL